MSASLKRGWCPSLDRPMASGDGLLVRVQPRRATLTPEAAHALAEASSRHGNGIMELTGRGNIQLRGLRPETIAPFAAAMEEAAIPSPAPLLVPPLLGADPGMDGRTEALVSALERAFARLPPLPGKFAVAVDGGGLLGGRAMAADLVAHPDGRLLPAEHGDAAVPVGFLRAVCPHPDPLPTGEGEGKPSPVGRGLGEGLSTAPGPFGMAPPFAQFDVAMLHGLADLAAAQGTTIRVTPWRAFVFAHCHTAPDDPRWITDPADPRLLVTACVGAPGCLRGTTPTRADAAQLRPTAPVHVSGCIKGCAHPGPAALTLVGRDGRYDLVRHGRTADTPDAIGLTLEDILLHA